jgi:hypothetical protein
MSEDTQQQLTLHVAPHPRAVWQNGDNKPIVGGVKVSGSLTVDHDLQPGDILTVSIADADGQVIAHTTAEVSGIAFKLLEQSGSVIGTERVHTAKVSV